MVDGCVVDARGRDAYDCFNDTLCSSSLSLLCADVNAIRNLIDCSNNGVDAAQACSEVRRCSGVVDTDGDDISHAVDRGSIDNDAR